MGIQTFEVSKTCTGFHQMPDLSSAEQCPGVGTRAIIQAEGDNLRYRMDGVAPTASVGNLLLENQTVELHGDLSLIYIITATSGGSANVHTFR
jgi:hypothetical protein